MRSLSQNFDDDVAVESSSILIGRVLYYSLETKRLVTINIIDIHSKKSNDFKNFILRNESNTVG